MAHQLRTFSISASHVACRARVSGAHSITLAPYPITAAFLTLLPDEGMMMVAVMGRSGVDRSLAVRAI